MAWNQRYTVQLVGCDVDNPNDPDAVSVEVAASDVEMMPRLQGESVTFGDSAMFSRYGAREDGEIVCMEFAKAVDSTGAVMDSGRIRKLILEVFRRRYYYIRRVWRIGSNHDAGTLARADYNHADLTDDESTDSLWHLTGEDQLDVDEEYPFEPAGMLPLRIVVDVDSCRPEYLGGGRYEMRVKFKAATEVPS